ncbi:predicted protein [Scheffersomyces stipitis CBS 6054]|uniref:VanZ-like domain-containing protein n=1 Tax=Scheffersomyces stipitis (strain ATCC 58785 / CBS 6054 / NBRC 10063 / NRRL Y-11545) TaxID=322104 RepID=A3GHP0_PICST|nr:predicted protein [Scheffersomyces stipitis CBS 6054]EAZ63082.2 predicted protein [Scheffersomyces stipitis CBS 6054]KAG2735909.1 hypothetical protein G9P44_002123 [Scheffersomyces stipitis]
MVSVRVPVFILFLVTLVGAGYLGFASIELQHDKLIHFGVFLVLTTEFYFVFDTGHKSLKTLRTITFTVCTVGGSVGSEVVQSLVNPTRVFDIYDIGCNVLGSLVGLVASSSYEQWRVRQSKLQRTGRYRTVPTDVIQSSSGSESEDSYVQIQMGDLEREERE